jgi:hypothetical protein
VLDRLHTPAELFVAPGEIHAFDAMVWRAPARAKWKATHAFLARNLALVPRKGEGEPAHDVPA